LVKQIQNYFVILIGNREFKHSNGRTEFKKQQMITDKQIQLLTKYYDSFATNKEKLFIETTLNKQPTDKELKLLKKYAFRYKMRMEATSINVDSRLEKLHRPNPTSTGRITYK
jgi:hypothetical protein